MMLCPYAHYFDNKQFMIMLSITIVGLVYRPFCEQVYMGRRFSLWACPQMSEHHSKSALLCKQFSMITKKATKQTANKF